MSELAGLGAAITAAVVFSGSRKGSIRQRRDEEMASLDHLAGISDVRFLGLPHIVLQADLVPIFYELFDEVRPDLVLTHSPDDSHDDHLAVYRATLPAARLSPSVLAYETPSTLPTFAPTTYFPIPTDALGKKLAAIGFHQSQTVAPVAHMSLSDWVSTTAAFRGAYFRVGLAEAFAPIRHNLLVGAGERVV